VSRLLALIVTFATLLIGQAYAACSGPAGQAGEQIYDSSRNIMAYCNGSIWTSMAGGVSVTIGGSTYNNTPGGSANQVQYNNGSGGFAGDSGLTYSGGLLTATNISTTDLTASGNVTAAAFYGDGSHLTGIGISSVPWVSITSVPAGVANISNSMGSVSATTFTASGYVSATTYYGDGSQLTGISTQTDRIVSGSAFVKALQDAGGEVSGTLKLTSTGSEPCDAAHYNAVRIDPVTHFMQMCRP
jgi:hypothetical protein